jgi:hypothetical protein
VLYSWYMAMARGGHRRGRETLQLFRGHFPKGSSTRSWASARKKTPARKEVSSETSQHLPRGNLGSMVEVTTRGRR